MLGLFTSTGERFLHHSDAIRHLELGYGTPISLQVAPTSRCNLNCIFCSNANRTRHEDLDVDQIKDLIIQLKSLGLKTVEWTGGGDPSMYKQINEILEFCKLQDLKQGMISNGVATAERISQDSLDSLTWLRISLNCLDYVKDIKVPIMKGTLGFSYVINDLTTSETFKRLDEYVSKYSPTFVRIVPNCQTTDEQQEENNRIFGEMITKMGEPYFYQSKVFQRPDVCYWNYFKPFVLHDGWVYPCSSVVLNSSADRQFNEKYRWVKIEELASAYKNKVKSFPTENCDHCVFYNQNQMLESIINPPAMKDFI